MKNPRIPPGPLLLPCGMSRTDRKRRPRSPTLCRRQPPSLRLMIRVSRASFEEHNARRGEARQGLRTWLNARPEAAKGYGSDRDYAGGDVLRLHGRTHTLLQPRDAHLATSVDLALLPLSGHC